MHPPGATAYGATKAAVRQLTKSVAQYCAEEKLNVRCNSVHPGIVRTRLWDDFAVEMAQARGIELNEYVARTEARVPLGRLT
jgi:NAD(P)-dependent dehydrogenase (short-subunit alcohol dehydrogenase family)